MRKEGSVIYVGSELGCSVWVPHSANPVTDQLAKQEAMCLVSFVRDFLPPGMYKVSLLCVPWFYSL